MDPIKYHLTLFPPRLRSILEAYPHWDRICEVRLRNGGPLSLTDHRGNILLNERGCPCSVSEAVICTSEELSYTLASFCGGSVYRFFDRLRDGFAVDDFGWRMGVCTDMEERGIFLPRRILGINLRIPRVSPLAALPIVKKMSSEGLFSLLIFSAPGEGKTTVLRSLASLLSLGWEDFAPIRVAVIDQRRELFPPHVKAKAGLLDVLPSCNKGEGISLATGLFSPQVILCDEIGSSGEADAVLNACSGGCYVVATAHAGTCAEARRSPYLQRLMESGKFRYGLFLKKEAGEEYRCQLQWERLL